MKKVGVLGLSGIAVSCGGIPAIRGFGLSVGRKRVISLMKRSKDKGAAIVHTILKLLTNNNGIARKDVAFRKRSLLSCAPRR